MFSFSQGYCSQFNAKLQTVLNTAEEYNNILAYSPPEPFKIYDTGTEEWIDYEKYGTFSGLGTETYEYTPRSLEVLAAASGEGIYPNSESVLRSPGLAEYLRIKKIKVPRFKSPKYNKVKPDDYQGNFYRWSLFDEINGGVTFFLAADALEKSGNFKHAVKAYYACLVFFPRAFEYTQWQTPWYIAPACVARIRHLTREHPEIGVKLEGCDIIIKNVFDNDVKNDIFIVNPGKLVPSPIKNKDYEKKTEDMSKAAVKKTAGIGKVKLLQYKNGHFGLTVDDKPYIVKGVSYSPSKIGLSPDFGTLNNLRDWSFDDYNKNGEVDGPYDAWVDANRNDKQDEYEVNAGDFALMKEMGVNTLRIYHYDGVNQDLLKDGYENYGFMYMMGNLIGMYAIDSGADWYAGTDYTDEKQKQSMLESVERMVLQYKDKPYVLMWVLGNENNYGTVSDGTGPGTGSQAQAQPEAYYKFVNECAKLIKSLDQKQRPVAICNGDAYLLDYCSKYAPDIDIYGANAYRGGAGFGLLWKDIARDYSKPVLITEFGCPSYAKGWNVARIEYEQAMYHKGNWIDIEYNSAGVSGGTGNALGGVIFEWTDEWWKSGYMFSADEHDSTSQWYGPFLDGSAYEEWFGICSLGDGEDSPFKRQLRKVYFMYRDLWKDDR
jgi:beta-glucuronidase